MLGRAASPGPLSVVVVGGGIAGLTTAIALRREGHAVLVLEKSAFSGETGAAITIQPNCNGILQRLGLDAATRGANRCVGIHFHDAQGTLVDRFDYGDRFIKVFRHDWRLMHRMDLHDALKDLATNPSLDGPPVTIRLSAAVVGVDPHKGAVMLASGETVVGHVVIGADGIHSVCRAFLQPAPSIQPRSTGKALFRFLIPRSVLLQDPVCRSYFEENGRMLIFKAADRRIVMYPCCDDAEINVLASFPRQAMAMANSDPDPSDNKERLISICQVYGPRVQAIVSHVDRTDVKFWELLDMDALSELATGRLALIGDAAHPLLPWLGQGGAQAVEDAASMGAMLARGTSPSAIPRRLKVYEEARLERVSKIQDYTRINGRDDDDQSPRPSAGFPSHMDFMKYNLGHDEWTHSREALKRAMSDGHA